MKNLMVRKVDEALYRDFKVMCASVGKTMQDVMKNLMEKAVKEHDEVSVELRGDKGKASATPGA